MQKFFRGQKVKIANKLPSYMDLFESGYEAIIVGSYSDIYSRYNSDSGGDNEYALVLLTKPPRWVAWYEEDLLEIVDPDRDKGEKFLQKYKDGRGE